MALKGKKKSRSRGSQARRRPAAAPRPSYGGRDKPRWYQTTMGLVIAFLVVASLAVFVWWLVASNATESRELEARQDELQEYTTDLRVLVQNLTPVTTELAGAATLGDDDLKEQATAWKNELGEAQTQVAQTVPPTGHETLGALMSQSLLLYVQSVEQYELLPQLEGTAREEVAAKALASLQAADNVFLSVIQLLDDARGDAELSPSGLTTPSQEATPTPGAEGSQTIEVPTGEDEGSETLEIPTGEDQGAGGGGKGGGGGKKGNGADE